METKSVKGPDGSLYDFPVDMPQEKIDAVFKMLPKEEEPKTTATFFETAAEGNLPDEELTEDIMKGVAIEGLRYGPAVAAGATGVGAPAMATILGLSEVAAEELDELLNGRDYKDFNEFMSQKLDNVTQGVASATLSTMGDKWVVPFVAKGTKHIKDFAKKVAASAGRPALIPKKIAPEMQVAQRFLRDLSPAKGKPFSLSLDQVNRGTQNIIENVGSWARSGMFAQKRMRDFDLRNIRAVDGLLERYLNSIKNQMTPKDFGDNLYGILTNEINFVGGVRKGLYDAVDNIVEGTGLRTNISTLQDLFNKRGFEAPATEIRNLLGGLLPKKGNDIPLEWAVEIKKRLNALSKGNIEPAIKNMLNEAHKAIKPNILKTLDQIPAAKDAYILAESYAGATAERLRNKVMGAMGKKLKDFPSAILNTFRTATPVKMDRLIALENLFTKGDFPGVKGASGLTKEMFEESVLQPIRHSVLSTAFNKETQSFSGKKLANALDRLEPDFAKKVFGKDIKILRDAATTLKAIESQVSGEKVIVKLMQAGVIGAAGTAVLSGQPITSIGAGGVALFLIPNAFSRILTQPRLTQLLTSGIAKGPGSVAFERMVTMVAAQNAAANMDLQKMSVAAQDFYNKLEEGTIFDTPGATGEWEEDVEQNIPEQDSEE